MLQRDLKEKKFIHYITHKKVWCTYSFYGNKYQAFANNDICNFHHSLSHVNSFILMQLLWVQYENFIIPTKIIHALSETWTEIVISDLRIILQFNIWHIAFKRTWENDSWWVWQNYPLEKDVINISWNSYFFVCQWCKKWMHLSIGLPSL